MTPFLAPGQKPTPKPPCAREEKLARIARAESRWGMRFPKSFVETVVEHEGETPEPNDFRIADGTSSCVNCFYIFETEPSIYDIEKVYARRAHRLPPRVFPFACDPGGNEICFDCRVEDAEPTVAFYDHETGRVVHVASSFDAFMAGLCESIDDGDVR